MVFVVSMGDLFHPEVPDEFIDSVMNTIVQCPQHVFQILTKRPERMANYFAWSYGYYPNLDHLYPSIWLGTSVSTQADAEASIPWLIKIPAAVRFVSYEPALEDINFGFDIGHGVGDLAIDRLKWLICGAESGPGARPFDVDWARSARDQCIDAGVPFFLKQMPVNGKLVKLPELDGRTWDQMPVVDTI